MSLCSQVKKKSVVDILKFLFNCYLLNKLLMVPPLQKVVKADDEARNAMHYYSIFY